MAEKTADGRLTDIYPLGFHLSEKSEGFLVPYKCSKTEKKFSSCCTYFYIIGEAAGLTCGFLGHCIRHKNSQPVPYYRNSIKQVGTIASVLRAKMSGNKCGWNSCKSYLFLEVEMISVGIDISKGKSTACILKSDGEIVEGPITFKHTTYGLKIGRASCRERV